MYPLVICYIAIENAPVEIIDSLINSMVDLSINIGLFLTAAFDVGLLDGLLGVAGIGWFTVFNNGDFSVSLPGVNLMISMSIIYQFFFQKIDP